MRNCLALIVCGVPALGCGAADIGESGNGLSSAIATSQEPAGKNCKTGGLKISTGLDDNRDSILSADEVDAVSYVCNGADGSAGARGPAGVDGVAGADGRTSRILLSPEPKGKNCLTGGIRLTTGVDQDGDGALNGTEADSTQYICNGASGAAGATGASSLINVIDEPAGPHCASAGSALQSGADKNGNGTLEASEVQRTAYVCNGKASGAVATVSPVHVFEPGQITSNGPTVLVLQASISVPQSGSVVVIGSAETFCYSNGVPTCGESNAGYLYIDNSVDPANSGGYSYFWLAPDTTNSVTRVAVVEAATAGTYSAYLRGSAGDGSIGFYRPELTLIFLPH